MSEGEYRQELHLMLGRLIHGSFTVVTFCSCGLSFYGTSIEAADKRWRAHKPINGVGGMMEFTDEPPTHPS